MSGTEGLKRGFEVTDTGGPISMPVGPGVMGRVLDVTGKVDGTFVAKAPITLDAAVLARGRERFDVFCSPCHGRTGRGDGMIVRRGFKQPSSYHVDRLRQMPIGYFYDVITIGFGAMPDYAAQIPPADRWAIAAYVRTLQFSQHAPASALSADEREKLDLSLDPNAAAAPEHHP